jgi:hypothetical protein
MFLENPKEKSLLFKHFKSEISKIFFLKAIADLLFSIDRLLHKVWDDPGTPSGHPEDGVG